MKVFRLILVWYLTFMGTGFEALISNFHQRLVRPRLVHLCATAVPEGLGYLCLNNKLIQK